MLKTLDRWTDRALRYAATWLVLSMLTCVVLGVISRQLNAPLSWSDEMAQYLLVWSGFTGWIIATRRHAHIRVTVLLDRFPKPVRLALELASRAGIVLLAWIMIRYSFPLIERNWDVEWVTLPISAALVYIPVPFAGLAMLLVAISDSIALVRGQKIETESPEQLQL